jgi:hypothetical protein
VGDVDHRSGVGVADWKPAIFVLAVFVYCSLVEASAG